MPRSLLKVRVAKCLEASVKICPNSSPLQSPKPPIRPESLDRASPHCAPDMTLMREVHIPAPLPSGTPREHYARPTSHSLIAILSDLSDDGRHTRNSACACRSRGRRGAPRSAQHRSTSGCSRSRSGTVCAASTVTSQRTLQQTRTLQARVRNERLLRYFDLPSTRAHCS